MTVKYVVYENSLQRIPVKQTHKRKNVTGTLYVRLFVPSVVRKRHYFISSATVAL